MSGLSVSAVVRNSKRSNGKKGRCVRSSFKGSGIFAAGVHFSQARFGTLISTTSAFRTMLQYALPPSDNQETPTIRTCGLATLPAVSLSWPKIALAAQCRRQQSASGHACTYHVDLRIGRLVDRLQDDSHDAHNLDKLRYSLACAPIMVWPGRLMDYCTQACAPIISMA